MSRISSSLGLLDMLTLNHSSSTSPPIPAVGELLDLRELASATVYRQLVRYLQVHTLNREDAAELAQETYALISKKAAAGVRVENGKKYLFGVARILALRSRCRTFARRLQFGLYGSDEADRKAPRSTGLRRRSKVRDAIAELPLELREVVFLRFHQGFQLEECAAHLKISLSTVKRKLDEAKERLRPALGAEGQSFDPESGAAPASFRAELDDFC